MTDKANPKNIAIISAIILVPLLAFIVLAGQSQSGSVINQSGLDKASSMPGAAPLNLWDQGSAVTLAEAQGRATIPLLKPSRLPSNTTLSEVRMMPQGNWFVLGYSTQGLTPIAGNSKGLSIIIFGVAQEHNPVFASSIQPDPMVTTVTYPNGTVVTFTEKQVINYNNGNAGSYITINGHLTSVSVSNDTSTLEWWSNGTLYEVIANLPQAETINIVKSMG